MLKTIYGGYYLPQNTLLDILSEFEKNMNIKRKNNK